MSTGTTRAPSTDPLVPGREDRRARWWRVAVALVAALAVAVWAAVLVGGGDDTVVGTSPSPAAVAPTSSAAPPQTPAASAPPSTGPTARPTTPPSALPSGPPPAAVVDRSTAVWPAAGAAGLADPVAAAERFATEYLGFQDPVVGEFQQGDSRSGEVSVRPSARGPVTTVLLRQLSGERTWSVLGTATDGIAVTTPAAGALVRSPVAVRGSAWTFEGQVTVQVRQDGRRAPLGEGFVTGGGDAMRPFSGTVAFATPTTRYGALVLLTSSAEDGQVWQAAVLRVQLQPGSAQPTPAAGQMLVTVWFSADEEPDAEGAVPLVPVQRVVPRTSGVLRASLTALLAGPTAQERATGLRSWFSPATAGMLRDVTLTDGTAVVDLHDLRAVVPGAADDPAGRRLLIDQLGATVAQFRTVRTVEYRIEGRAGTFADWLQPGGPGGSG